MAIPSSSPLILPVVVCQGPCKTEKMRLDVTRNLKGAIVKIVAYCDVCKYGRELSFIYAQGLDVKYVAPANAADANGTDDMAIKPPAPAPQVQRPTPPPTPQAVGADAEENPALVEAMQKARETEPAVGLTGQ